MSIEDTIVAICSRCKHFDPDEDDHDFGYCKHSGLLEDIYLVQNCPLGKFKTVIGGKRNECF